ncbi:hypothetical protein [Helcococcus ovis]|uniref:hypothetical protein n=1 Tax=Helcococcus ovis TaxID=72026 RepID=UPI00106FF865|nr:hypothetical protein [Helcococcus ovis]TFF65821.1 hypothetical protein EQF93_07960 [Helcococcus ovis]WNZ00748.1 hypothetical protein EQF90_005665 [Helcococcus ovis]
MILENQKFQATNVLSFRAKMTVDDFNNKILELQNYIKKNNLQEIGHKFSTVYLFDSSIIDMEVFVSVDRKIDVRDNYNFIEEFTLENALKYKMVGNPNKSQDAFNKLKNYIEENGFIQKTPVYTVTITDFSKIKTIDELEKVEIDIYVEVEKV